MQSENTTERVWDSTSNSIWSLQGEWYMKSTHSIFALTGQKTLHLKSALNINYDIL